MRSLATLLALILLASLAPASAASNPVGCAVAEGVSCEARADTPMGSATARGRTIASDSKSNISVVVDGAPEGSGEGLAECELVLTGSTEHDCGAEAGAGGAGVTGKGRSIPSDSRSNKKTSTRGAAQGPVEGDAQCEASTTPDVACAARSPLGPLS